VDVVFSNSVLEHVPPEAIRRLMHESSRILRPGGLAIHSANCGDHYAYFDSKITPINYLTYSESTWRRWNNDLLYQNRLRPSDFLVMAEQAGLRIVLQKSTARPELLDKLPSMEIATEFKGYPREQLASTSVDFVAQA
jgi:SAM-dependent methyltransferase